MKILIANKYYFVTGGPERYLFNVSELLENEGHKVVPFSLRSHKNEYSEYDHYFLNSPLGIGKTHFNEANKSLSQKLKLTVNAVYSLAAKRQVEEIIEKEKIDVVYLLNICNYLSPSIIDAAKAKGVKVVMRLSDFNFICSSYMFYRNGGPCDDCQKSLTNAIKYRCMKDSLALSMARVVTIKLHRIMGIYNKVDAFIAPSRRMASALEEFGIDRSRIHFVPSFVNLQNYEPCYENRGYALYFGRLSPEKGVNILLEAWEQLREKAPELKIVGSGVELDRLLKMKKQWNLDSVNFYDFTTNKDELIGLIKNSSFVLIPSLWEDNSPMAAYEAMALGKPIIASGLGGLLDQIENNKSGYLVKHGDPKALADAVLKLCADKDKMKNFGNEARARMEKLFSPSVHLKSLQAVFK